MLTVRLKPSRRLAVLLAAAHLAAIALIWPLALPLWLKIPLALALAASLAFHLRSDIPHAVAGIEIGEDGISRLKTNNGTEISAQLLGGSFVSPALTVLAFRPQQRRFSTYVTILPDSLAPDEFRRLRVWLKWKVNFAAVNSMGTSKPG